MKHTQTFFLLALLVFASFGITKVRILDDRLAQGDEFEVFTAIRNSDISNAEDVRVFIDFPELGYFTAGPRFDIDDADHYSRISTWDVPAIAPGEYTVRITASNDDKTVRKFRRIIIG